MPEESTIDQSPIVKAEADTGWESYYLALGKFAHQYSILESIVNGMLVNVSGVSDEVGKAIYSGTRVNTAKSLINRVLEATNRLDLKNRIQPYFERISLITTARDEILHYGVSYSPDLASLVFRNTRAAHVERTFRSYKVSSESIDHLTADTQTSYCGILKEWCRDSASPESLAVLQTYMTLPWRYILPPLIPPEQATPSTSQ